MKAKIITRESPTADELEKLYRSEKDGRMKERLHTMVLMHELKSAPKVAKIIKRSRNTVWEWTKAFNEQGLEGLVRKSPPGPKSSLDAGQLEILKKDILKHPHELGYEFSNWDGKNVGFHIKNLFGVELKVRRCQELLHELGFSLQRPSTVPAKADPVKKEEFKEEFKKRWMI